MAPLLDTGVIIAGATRPWGATKAVLILATRRDRITIVLARAVEDELQAALARKVATASPEEARAIASAVEGWLARVRLERWPLPTLDELRATAHTVPPALRQTKDLPAVVTATQARPDWIISANPRHWNEALATRIGLPIVTPEEFLHRLLLGAAR